MAYTKEDLFYLGVTDLQSARKKIVDISLFDNIDNIKLSDKTKKDIEFTKEIYIKIKRSEIAHRFRNFTQNSHIII